MYQNINITLPDQIAYLIEQMRDKKTISKFVEDAVIYYMEQVGKMSLKEQVKQGALKRAERDLKISQEWNGLEDSIW